MDSIEHSWQYCRKVLPEVSRTFALNIGVLRGELYRSVLLGYLICRIIDTVEDSPSLTPSLKEEFLRSFSAVIAGPNWQCLLEEWLSQLRASKLDGKPQDTELLWHSGHVLKCFKHLAPGYQRVGEKMFSIMTSGMAKYVIQAQSGRFILCDLRDLKQYCYYVAGVVGEFLLGNFCLAYTISEQRSQILKKHCVDFGLGLQMTNIAKDILKDRQRGQTFLPESFLQEAGLSKEEFLAGKKPLAAQAAYYRLLKEAYSHLMAGYQFSLAIPRRHLRLRLFCIWPLWMAFETLKTLHTNPDLLFCPQDVKITRKQVKRILRHTTLIIASNTLIEKSFSCHYKNML